MKKIFLNNLPLSDIEYDTCWMAIRYAQNRTTISCSTLPNRLIEEYWYRWTDEQKQDIVIDLERNEKTYSKFNGAKAFGDENIDRPSWLKFWKALDVKNHTTVRTTDGSEYVVFEANDRIYPLNSYIENPYKEIYIDKENIEATL